MIHTLDEDLASSKGDGANPSKTDTVAATSCAEIELICNNTTEIINSCVC